MGCASRYRDLMIPAFIAMLGALQPVSQARAAGDAPEEDMLGDIPAVSTATRLSQPRRDAPAMVTVITRDMIEASGATQIPDVLRLAPGMLVGRVLGNFITVGKHGPTDAFGRRLQVQIDGISVYTPFISFVDWLTLPLEINDVDRIEIVHGPSVTTHGSNAFFGTINIITRRPVQDEGTTLQGTVGDWQTRNAYARYARDGEELAYRLSGAYLEDEGFEDVANDDLLARKLYGMVEYRPNAASQVGLDGGYTNADNGAGGVATGGGEFGEDRDRELESYYGRVRYRKQLSTRQDFSVQAYYHAYTSEDRFRSPLLSEIFGVDPATIQAVFGKPDQSITLGTTDGDASRGEIEAQHIFSPSSQWQVVWGGSVRRDRFASDFWTQGGASVEQDSFRLFGNGEWRPGTRWTVNLGAMYESYEGTGDYTSPRLGINYHVSAPLTLRMSAARAYRIPSLFETHGQYEQRFDDGDLLNITYDRNPDLDTEEIDSVELGLLFQPRAHELVFDLRVFREEIERWVHDVQDDAVVDPLGDGALTFSNDGEFDILGLEMQLEMVPWRNGSLYASYTYLDVEGRLGGQRGQPRELTPENAFSVLLSHQLASRWQLSGAYYFVESFEWEGDGNEVDDYDRLDLRVAKTLRVGRSDVQVALIGQSVTGSVEDFRDDNIFDTRVFLQLSARVW